MIYKKIPTKKKNYIHLLQNNYNNLNYFAILDSFSKPKPQPQVQAELSNGDIEKKSSHMMA